MWIKGKKFKSSAWCNTGAKSFNLFSIKDKQLAIDLANKTMNKIQDKEYKFVTSPFGRNSLIPNYVVERLKNEFKEFRKKENNKNHV